MNSIPTLAEAEAYLREAQLLNPGPWVDHSLYVARAAQAIAAGLSRTSAPAEALDAGIAYILGLLHDIGRRFGVTGTRHILDGYTFMHERGYNDAARICLTHSYPYQHAEAIYGVPDWTVEEGEFVARFLGSLHYTAYDHLIQLCDALALPTGFCLVEKRFVDVVTRYGFNALTIPKWQATLAIKAEFERALGGPIYDLLPGVVENTFASQR